MKREKGYMDWDTLETIIEQSIDRTKVCYLHGFGEPLLHADIFDMINYVHSRGLSVYLSTNSLLLDNDAVHILFNCGLDRLYLPLSTLNETKYESIRTGSNFKTVLNNIDNCIKIRKECVESDTKIVITPIMMKETLSDVYDVMDIYSKILDGVGDVEIKGYCDYGKSVPNKAVSGFESPPGFCTMTNYGMMIYWNGDVVTCCNDYDKFMYVGNILYSTIDEIWNSDVYDNYRNLKSDFCKRCLG